MLKSNFKKQGEQNADVANPDIDEDDYRSNVPDGDNSVGAGKARRVVVWLVFIVAIALVYYFIIFQSNSSTVEEYDVNVDGSVLDQQVESSPPPAEETVEILPDNIVDEVAVPLERPELPELPSLPELPDLPDVAEDIYQTEEKKDNIIDPVIIEENPEISDVGDQTLPIENQEREIFVDPRKTPIMAIEGSISPGNSVGYEGNIVDLTGEAIQNPITEVPVAPIERKDLSQTISQGKMLTAILETAINTEIPGEIRGIVNRDVYAEAGNNILIPKGTRLFGTYSTNITRGQARVEISWSRIIRPDGIDVDVSLIASDGYGRSGIEGEVDNQYTATLANAILTSILAVGGAIAADEVSGNDGATTTGNDGSVISTTTASAQVVTQVTTAIVDTVTQMINDSINIRQVIRIPHGTKMMVIVSQDLTLPPYNY